MVMANRKLMSTGPAAAWPFPTESEPASGPDTPQASTSLGVRKNKQTINEFLMYTLGMTLTNRAWAWDGYDDRTVVMKLWDVRKIKDTNGTVRIEVYAPRLTRRKAGAAATSAAHTSIA